MRARGCIRCSSTKWCLKTSTVDSAKSISYIGSDSPILPSILQRGRNRAFSGVSGECSSQANARKLLEVPSPRDPDLLT